MRCRILICFWLGCFVMLFWGPCSAWKSSSNLKIRMLCFVIMNSVLFNLLCVWELPGTILMGAQRWGSFRFFWIFFMTFSIVISNMLTSSTIFTTTTSNNTAVPTTTTTIASAAGPSEVKNIDSNNWGQQQLPTMRASKVNNNINNTDTHCLSRWWWCGA